MSNQIAQAMANAMLCSLRISMFNPTRADRTATKEVHVAHNAAADAGSYRKNLIPKELLKPVSDAAKRASDTHRLLTCPWLDDGQRIVSLGVLQNYLDAMADAELEFNAAVDLFMTEYPGIRAQAPQRLGSLFDPNDYPPEAEARARFRIAYGFTPLASSDDFRTKLALPELEAEIKAKYDATVNEALAKANSDLYERLGDRLAKIAARLNDPDAIFRDSLIENLREVVRVLPDMMVVSDPNLAQLCRDAATHVAPHTPQELRDNRELRRRVGDVAAKLASLTGVAA